MSDWDGMSEDEIQRRLDEAFARIRAVGEAQEHVWLEQKFAESPEHAWPPMPGTAHPSLDRMAAGVRGLMARGEHTVLRPGLPCWGSAPAAAGASIERGYHTLPSINQRGYAHRGTTRMEDTA